MINAGSCSLCRTGGVPSKHHSASREFFCTASTRYLALSARMDSSWICFATCNVAVSIVTSIATKIRSTSAYKGRVVGLLASRTLCSYRQLRKLPDIA